MGRVMVAGGKPDMTAPVAGILLSSIAEGSIVKLNENGSPVEFYVAKHDYESSLNGTGRTLLVRKDCYDQRKWHSSKVNAYATSDIDAWMNGDYKSLLDADVQTAIDTTTFYYTPGNGNTTVTRLERSIFLLSATELDRSLNGFNVEGTALEISAKLQIAYMNGSAVGQWTRSPYTDGTVAVGYVSNGGGVGSNYCTDTSCSRPAFTLPNTAVFDEETLLFKGVA